ncbi:hypothetical protein [Vibrio harveyi]|uniref:hypothetical protein n=1 Tax=Vibrio harveyi TaxID=669 RepID=UPI00067FCE96|nr:hypothetical protein [Vibrio harveyi]
MPEFQGRYVPENALNYVIATNLKATRLAQSGAMAASPMEVGAGFVNVQPFWGDLSGEFSDNESGSDLNFDAIESSSSVAPIINVEKGWAQDGIVDAVTMGDQTVITQMVSRVAGFSNREVNRIGLQVAVAGSIGASTEEYPTVIDLSATGEALGHTHVISGMGLFGERQNETSTIWMHSDVQTHLNQLDMVSNEAAYVGQYAPYGTVNRLALMIDNHLRPTVIQDVDGEDVKIYPILIGAANFSAYGDGSVARKIAHTFYDDKADEDRLSTRQRMTIHTWGCNYKPVAQDRPATLSEVMNPVNYESAFDGVDMGAFPFRAVVILAAIKDFTPVVPAP